MGSKNYGLVESIEELAQHAQRIIDDGLPFGFDLETGYLGPDQEKASVRPETAFIVGISFTNSLDWARYVPLRHDVGDNLDSREVARILWPLMNTGLGVAHNAGFELRHLAKFFRELLSDDPDFGPAVRESNGYFPIRADSMVDAYLAAEYEKFGLKVLTKLMFDHQMTELKSLFPKLTAKQEKALRFNPLDMYDPRVIEYACEDALWCLAIHLHYYPQLKDMFLYGFEQAIVAEVVPEMEDFGVRYDWDMMLRGADDADAFRDRLNAEIMADLSAMAGETIAINLNAPAKISEVLFGKLGMKTTVYTAKTKNLPEHERKMSTGKIALERLSKQYPVVKKIIAWKELYKLSNTYLRKYPERFGYAPDGNTHPNHMSAVVSSGRFAVSDPAYQQSPKAYHIDLAAAVAAHAEGVEPPEGTCFKFNFRDVITCPPGYYMLGFDLSQAELRWIAGEAQEPELLRAFAEGIDVHTLTTSLMLGIPVEQVDKKIRDIGKAQPLDAQILTPTGWRAMGELQVGDQVIGSDGEPVKITGVFPQGMREVFRVTTSDGASTECCGEHLWTVEKSCTRPKRWITKELRELVAAGLYWPGKIMNGKSYPQAKYKLPARPVVQYEPGPELPIDPYVLGALLGDGGFTHSWAPSFGSNDQELLDAVRAEHERLGGRWASEKEQSPGFFVAYLAGGERFNRETNALKTALKDLGLWGVRDHQKFVPEIYQRGTPAERLAMLQGLLDTDGTVAASGGQFRVTSKELALAVQSIARSLGGWASFAAKPIEKTPYHIKSDPLPQWEVYLRLPAGMCPFRLKRKVAKWKAPVYAAPQTIQSVELVGEKEVQCISVDAQNGLYVTEGFIVTHNTLNFALLYGMGVKSLADRLAIPRDEAQMHYDAYFRVYSRIAAWAAKQVAFGKEHGYVVSKFGRKLPIWDYKKAEDWQRAKGDRVCVNAPVQGGATGDYMKIAMVLTRKALRAAGLHDRVHLVMNVHDALEWYVHSSVHPAEVINVLKPAVLYPLPFPGWPEMKADWHIARRLGTQQNLELTPDGKLIIKDTGVEIVDKLSYVDSGEDDGELIPDLPEIEAETIRRSIEHLRPAPRAVILTLPEAPDGHSWMQFIDYLAEKPGNVTWTVRIPEGEVPIELLDGTGRTPDDHGAVAAILGPCELAYAESTVDYGTLVEGLAL